MHALARAVPLALCLSLLSVGCKKREEAPAQATPAAGAPAGALKVGLVTDVGGRGDQSFNDSALRGLELWAAGKKYSGGGYQPATPEDIKATLAGDLATRQSAIAPMNVIPLILQSRAQEDYDPNLQTLVDQGAALAIGVGFLLENAIESVARRNPEAKFLLIDSPVLDAKGNPTPLPNVRTVVFREQEGSFLVGALAGLVSKSGKIGFVGGMESRLIKKFEAGFRAGVLATRPDAAQTLVVGYTGSFDNIAAGKQVAQDMIAKGVDVLFHAAGTDGQGVIQAAKEAKAAGKAVYAIGVDSDQHHLAPDVVLTSMLKRVDLAVYDSIRQLSQGQGWGGDVVLGLKEGGVTYADVRVDFPGKLEALAKVEALRERIASGELKVPSHPDELAANKGAP